MSIVFSIKNRVRSHFIHVFLSEMEGRLQVRTCGGREKFENYPSIKEELIAQSIFLNYWTPEGRNQRCLPYGELAEVSSWKFILR